VDRKDLVICLEVLVLLAGFTILMAGWGIEESPPDVARTQSVYGSGLDLSTCEQLTEEDVYDLCLKIWSQDPEEFKAVVLANKLHGNINPHTVYGAKMGTYAKKLLNAGDNELLVLSDAGITPPISGLNDGIAASTGATLGRGLMHNVGANRLAARFFHENKSVQLQVKPDVSKIADESVKKALEEHGGYNDGYYAELRTIGLQAWEKQLPEDLFNVDVRENWDLCEYNTYNARLYLNRLHSFIHTNPTNRGIMKFIDEDPCVKNGTVNKKEYTVTSVWKSNNETVHFYHIKPETKTLGKK